MGGTRQCRFDGINFKPHKPPENAQTPIRRVHAVLGAGMETFSFSVFYMFWNLLYPMIIIMVRAYYKNVVLDKLVKFCISFNLGNL